MRLSISNIACESDQDNDVYGIMKELGYTGLEIAPTRVFPEAPYDALERAEEWNKNLKMKFGFDIPSMQSIWYGRNERLFGSEDERRILFEYSKKAVDFASVLGCGNLVFGCPRNRYVPEGVDSDIAVPFFRELGKYAKQKGTVIGMEANPPIYNTNFINDTKSAIELIEKVDSEGFKLNLDVGTIIENGEDVYELVGQIRHINHVHISEPLLRSIEKRELHGQLRKLLEIEGYCGYVSIEMKKTENISTLREVMEYVKEVFV